MFYIIEKESQLHNLPEFDKCFVHIITNNNNYHPAIATVSLVYVKPFTGKGYMLCINHNESLSLKWQSVRKYLSEKELYAIDSKHTRYFFKGPIHDATFNRIAQGEDRFDFGGCEPVIVSNFYRDYGTLKNVNELIPIPKHYEYCENIYNLVKPYLTKNTEYINKLVNVFYKIEREGIKLDKECFIKYHEEHRTPHFSIKQGVAYTSYNLYTLTGRPSNAFNSINYAALNKDNGERSCYIPRNDVFIEFDFNGYHPRLLGTIVGYNFDYETNVYEQIAKILKVKDVPKVKETTFQNLYGGIRPELQDKPFFKQVHLFTEDLWNTLQYSGRIETPSGKVFRSKDIDNPTPQKVLNYYIQNFETSQNVVQLDSIFSAFKPLKSRIVLYTYDSILVDASREELPVIREVIAKLQYPVRIKTGLNYNELK
jgi:hypothetical protein